MNKFYNRVAALIVFLLGISCCSNLISQAGWYQLNSGTNITLNSVCFVNDYTGFMVGSGIAIKTTNGGFNWLVIPTLGGGTSIKFINNYIGYAVNGTVLKTTDGGLSWANKNLSNLKDICFADANTGYAVGEYSAVIKTTDGGTTWTNQNVGFAYNDFKSVTFINANTGFIVGGKMLPPYGCVVYKTVNGGTTWALLNVQMLNSEFRCICFPSAAVGYIVGSDLSSESGVIFKSSDGGDTWAQTGVTYKDLNSVYFVNENTGYIAGNSGLVLKTTDASILWVSQLINTTNDLNSIFFTKPDIGFTAGVSGDIQKTLLGGNNGPPFSIEGKVTYNTLSGAPVANAKVVAISYNYTTGQISRVDSAVTNSNGIYNLVHIPGIDSTDIMAYPNDELADCVHGFYGGSSGGTIFWANSQTLFPTSSMTNINISVYQTPPPSGIRKISGGVFTAIGGAGLADARVYAKIGSNYIKVGSSVNGGAYSDTHLQPGTYDLICDRMGYKTAYRTVTLTGATDLDSINFYLTSFFPIGIINQNLYTPKDFALKQNFPNPFNPVTNIRFDIPRQTNVRLSVYDILGREIEVLVNNSLKPGTYKADWHADKYSSGLYFYKLVTDDYVDVKKMILVK